MDAKTNQTSHLWLKQITHSKKLCYETDNFENEHITVIISNHT